MIYLNEPSISRLDYRVVNKNLRSTWVSSSGLQTSIFEKKIAKYVNSKYAVSFVNGTSALHIAVKLINVSYGDEIIVPTITFIAPINAVIYNGASPIFMDCDNFCNIDIAKLIEFIKKKTFYKNGYTYNKKTKKKIVAIIIVHVWGNAVSMEQIFKLCKKKNIKIIEDASESLGTKYISGKFKNRYTGTIGDIGVFSFNGNKIITTGGGGVMTTNNKKLYLKAKYLSTQAIDNKDLYIHNEIGYNYRMPGINAALGLSQLMQINFFLKKKKKINFNYKKLLKKNKNFIILESPKFASNNFWQNVVFCKKGRVKKKINTFKKYGIQTRAVWLPNHLQKPFKKFQNFKIINANKIVKHCLCLPSSINLRLSDQKKIVKILKL